MNQFEARDQLMTRVAALADRYSYDEGQAAAAAAKAVSAGGIAGMVYALGYLSALVVEAAEVHAADCRGGCRTCDLITSMLAVLIAQTRKDIDQELAKKMRARPGNEESPRRDSNPPPDA